MLFFAIVVIVWFDNRRLLRLGGYSFRGYWSQAWRKMRLHWRKMDPSCAATRLRRSDRNVHSFTIREAPSRMNGWLH